MTDIVAQFVKERGGAKAVADKTGRKAGAVRLWVHRNKVPRDAWPELIEAFDDVTLEKLREVEAASCATA